MPIDRSAKKKPEEKKPEPEEKELGIRAEILNSSHGDLGPAALSSRWLAPAHGDLAVWRAGGVAPALGLHCVICP